MTFAPFSFGNGEFQDAIDRHLAARAFLLWAIGSLLAGVGFWREARHRATAFYVFSAAAIVGGVLHAATHH